ncbi:MAG: bifunctional oligoribonuclease/PAP phosphatase NrnA [Ktedonobacteraceae bacterium]|nr:bifunctional oligoribonuclease/PAP phosphatase NrnA [Ktedonobacteraceae bacterium]
MSNNSYPAQRTALNQQLDPLLVEQAMTLITPAQRIALLAHEHPDGDCLGSALGLAHILCQTGKYCVPACADPAPAAFSFLPGLPMLQTSLGDENFDLVIALDAGELERFGSLYQQHRTFLERIPIINIDHHVSSQGCGQVNIIETSAAATAELLVLFQQQAGLPLSRDAAICLLTGMITDTGSFQYTSTTARTMEAAAVLLRAGAVAETIVRPIYRVRSLTSARFEAAIINNAHTACNGRLIWSYATSETLAATGADASIDGNFSGMLRDIEGVQIAAFFKNYGEPQQTRLSLRTEAPYNAAEICMRFGGGGHARAAGATINLPLEEAMRVVIMALEQELNKG